MKDRSDSQLLRSYAEHGDDAAFSELVGRYADFVYSSALRQVYSCDSARDVAQSVFIDLVRKAGELCGGMGEYSSLAGWLHRATRYAALNHIRETQRRIARERQAMEQILNNSEPPPDWESISPILDEALDSLDEQDREALLLRYFSKNNFQTIGQTLGISDDASQKRVSRAVDRLRDYYAKRGVVVGVAGLAALLASNSVQAAPPGFAASILSAACMAGTGSQTSAVIAVAKTITMTTLQKITITAAFVLTVGAVIHEASQATRSESHSAELEKQIAPMTEENTELKRVNAENLKRIDALVSENETLRKNPREVLKLRSEVGRLRQENATIGSASPLNKITANAEMKSMMREQQKVGMAMIFKGLTSNLNLSTEQTGKFNDLLADSVMENIDRITEVLQTGKKGAALDQVFRDQDAATEQKIQALVGQDGLAQYKDYSRNLLGAITSDQFKTMMTGDEAAKTAKANQMKEAILQESQTALASYGLPADYQTLPILNFRNIASEETGNQTLDMVDGIYDKVRAGAVSYLSPEELEKFKDFQALAKKNTRAALLMNRSLMAPISK